MDLDSIKKSWNDTSFGNGYITNNQINSVISKKGIPALKRLFYFEIIGLIILLPLVFAPYIHNLYFPRAPYPILTKYFFIGSCIIFLFWQVYKIRLLRSINLGKVDILYSYNTISKYKLFIKREFLVGAAFLAIFMFSYSFKHIDIIDKDEIVSYYCFNLLLFVVATLLMLILYKLVYKKNITNIENSFKEIKEMKKE